MDSFQATVFSETLQRARTENSDLRRDSRTLQPGQPTNIKKRQSSSVSVDELGPGTSFIQIVEAFSLVKYIIPITMGRLILQVRPQLLRHAIPPCQQHITINSPTHISRQRWRKAEKRESNVAAAALKRTRIVHTGYVSVLAGRFLPNRTTMFRFRTKRESLICAGLFSFKRWIAMKAKRHKSALWCFAARMYGLCSAVCARIAAVRCACPL